jgi:hypothetical protein
MDISFIELAGLSGYVLLFDDIYKRNFKDKIVPVWEKILTDRGTEFVYNFISSYLSVLHKIELEREKWSNLEFTLKYAAECKIRKLDLKKYNSKLLEKVYKVWMLKGSEKIFKLPYGCFIFISLYLLDKFSEEQKNKLLNNYFIQDVYNRIHNEK